jgi:hypothetical protein
VNDPSASWLRSDYNNIFIAGTQQNAVVGTIGGNYYYDIASWRAATLQDNNSNIFNPLFANPGGDAPADYKPGLWDQLLGMSLAGPLPALTDDHLFNGIRPASPALPAPPNPLRPTMGAWEMCKVFILQHPQPDGDCDGGGATFSVTSLGSAPPNVGVGNPLAYQWQYSTDGGTTWINIVNGGAYSGATTANLTINPLTLAMNGWLIRCQVTASQPVSSCSVTVPSYPATLSVTTPPTTSLIWHQ